MKVLLLALLAAIVSGDASEPEPQLLSLRALLSTDQRGLLEEQHACSNLSSIINKLRKYGLEW
jgi:hypothetical protein